MRLLLPFLFGLLTACGVDGDPNACRSSGDCSGDAECLGPNAPQVCGIPPRQGCASDADCSGQRCHAISDPCSPDGVGSECRAACTEDAACGADMRCVDGACRPLSCEEGYACPAQQACEPSRFTEETPVYDRHHGCFNQSCSGDADCGDSLSCVNGVCQTGLGSCVVPMAVP